MYLFNSYYETICLILRVIVADKQTAEEEIDKVTEPWNLDQGYLTSVRLSMYTYTNVILTIE